MKIFFSVVWIVMMFACNNQAGNSNGSGNDSNSATNKKKEQDPDSGDGNCGNSLLFRKGAEILTSSYDGQGKEIAKQVSTLTKVYEQGGMTISEVAIKSTDEKGADEKT